MWIWTFVYAQTVYLAATGSERHKNNVKKNVDVNTYRNLFLILFYLLKISIRQSRLFIIWYVLIYVYPYRLPIIIIVRICKQVSDCSVMFINHENMTCDFRICWHAELSDRTFSICVNQVIVMGYFCTQNVSTWYDVAHGCFQFGMQIMMANMIETCRIERRSIMLAIKSLWNLTWQMLSR